MSTRPTMVAVLLAALALAGCGSGGGSSAGASEAGGTNAGRDTSGTETSAAERRAPLDACELVTADDAQTVMGVPAQLDEDSPAPAGESNCHYVNTPPADEREGQVLRQLQVSVYDGAQYYDNEGIVFPTYEREELDLGDASFVHLSDGLLGLTIQVLDGDTMYSVSYVETAIMSDEVADTAGKRDALVELMVDKLG